MIERLPRFLKPEQTDTCPIIEARPFRTLAGGEPLPIALGCGLNEPASAGVREGVA
jgi:hypothetical protein